MQAAHGDINRTVAARVLVVLLLSCCLEDNRATDGRTDVGRHSGDIKDSENASN
jgi:hypothetical protein